MNSRSGKATIRRSDVPPAGWLRRATLMLVGIFTLFATTANAKTCADVVVHAAGEPASYEWLARIKTHANWRSKVRNMSNLGDPFANWERAENSSERCFSGPEGTVCEFTGTPCRKD
ncbi:MAG: hypothetical protein RIC14_10150 [Filomicrobium sp.]